MTSSLARTRRDSADDSIAKLHYNISCLIYVKTNPMSDVSDKTVLVYDHGLFLPFAERLAREFKRVLYFSPWERGFNVLRDNIIAEGLPQVERCEDIWQEIDAGNVDIAAFPDIGNSGLQLHLEKIGIPVWGSRAADKLEWNRVFFKQLEGQLKIPVPKYHVIEGIPALRKYLAQHDNCYIKWSKYRGDMETTRHINYALSEQWLDALESQMSPVKRFVKFVVEDELVTDLEDGLDTINIDGNVPDEMIHGVEVKDSCYLASVQKRKDIKPEMRDILQKFAPFFKENRYRNFISTEVRIKDGIYYFTDATLRQPSPAGECELELIDNLPEIVWRGARGELAQPVFSARFGAQAIIRHKGDEDEWRPIQIPEKVKRWVKLYRAFFNGEAYQIAPVTPHFQEVGSVIGIGNSFEEAINHLKQNVDAIKNNPIDVETDSIYYGLQEIHSAKDEGIKFANKVPEPEQALS